MYICRAFQPQIHVSQRGRTNPSRTATTECDVDAGPRPPTPESGQTSDAKMPQGRAVQKPCGLPSPLACACESKRNPHRTPSGSYQAQSEVSWSSHRVQCLHPSTPSCLGAHLATSRDAPRPSQPPTLFKLHRPSPTSSPTPTDLSRRPHHLCEPFASPPSHAQKGLSGSGLYAIIICSRERAPPSPNAERRKPGERGWCARFAVWVNRITRRADVYVCAACLRWSHRVWFS